MTEDNKNKEELSLEEDDIFEEFESEEWQEVAAEDEAKLWEADWDDEEVSEDFSKALKAEVAKNRT